VYYILSTNQDSNPSLMIHGENSNNGIVDSIAARYSRCAMEGTSCVRTLIPVLTALFFAASAAPTQAGGAHEGDLIVARNGAGQLEIEDLDPIANPIHLNAVNGPLLFGWTGDEPGFDSLETDEPVNDLFVLQAGASIRLEAVSIDPALKIWAPGFGAVIDAAGEQVLLGGEAVHAHVTWHIDSNDPGFVPGQTEWQAVLKLVDTGSTNYSESEPFAVTFTDQPAIVPAITLSGMIFLIAVIGAAGVALSISRNRRRPSSPEDRRHE